MGYRVFVQSYSAKTGNLDKNKFIGVFTVKVAVIGANGQLGTELCLQFAEKHRVFPLTHGDIEVSDIDDVSSVLNEIKPNLVVNTAAFHNLPECEKNPELSFRVNSIGALNLAKITSQIGAKLVHYSTDNVFDGTRKQPYLESDKTAPLNIFGLTKLNGEIIIKNYSSRHFILRLSGIYGTTACRARGKNFITMMQNAAVEKEVVKVTEDEILSPTPVEEIVRNTLLLSETEAYGLYHMTCEGECSWFDFARVIFRELNLKTPLISCKRDEFTSTVKHPAYRVLENYNLKTVDLNRMPHWEEALVTYLRNEIL